MNRWWIIRILHPGYKVVLFSLIAGGLYFRLKGLGEAPFWTDEYYIAQSVRNVLAHGLPSFDCGGLYTRGILLQYLAAPFFWLGFGEEYYFRLITVLFNLLTIPPLYLLARRTFGSLAAGLLVAMFSFSAWEIEMARFARMYAPFQMLFVWHVYFLYQAVIDRNSSALRWMYGLTCLSMLVYEGTIFLAIMNFIPVLYNREYKKLRNVLLPLAILGLVYAFVSWDTRHMGVETHPPANVEEASSHGANVPIEIPFLFLKTVSRDVAWLGGFLVLALLSAVGVVRVFVGWAAAKNDPAAYVIGSIFALCILLSLLNLYTCILSILFIAYLLRIIGTGDVRSQAALVTGGITLLGFLFWILYGASTDVWYDLLAAPRRTKEVELLIALFNYPPIYSKVMAPWLKAMPIFTIATVLLIAVGTFMSRRDEGEKLIGYHLMLLVVVGCVLVLAVLRQQYVEIRYTFFIYPIVLLLLVGSVKRMESRIGLGGLKRGLVTSVVIVSIVALSNDFSYKHLINIDKPERIYRFGYNRAKERQLYQRHDSRGPAQYVNSRYRDKDVVILTVSAVAYYLRKVDYFYLSSKSHKFRGVIGCDGNRHLWSNALLISQEEDLERLLLNNKQSVWFIVQAEKQTKEMPELLKLRDRLVGFREFTSADGTIEVFRVPPKGLNTVRVKEKIKVPKR
jgi:hypothetical protein